MRFEAQQPTRVVHIISSHSGRLHRAAKGYNRLDAFSAFKRKCFRTGNISSSQFFKTSHMRNAASKRGLIMHELVLKTLKYNEVTDSFLIFHTIWASDFPTFF